MKKILTLIFLICLFLPFQAWAATYYVAQSSAGGADGTAYADRASVAYHNAGSGVFAALDGDTVYLCDSITSQLTPPDSGSSGSVVTYRGDLAGHACTFSGGANGIYADEIDYIIVRDITFTDQTYAAIYLNNLDYWTIQDCILSSTSDKYGIILRADAGYGGVSNITIQDCDFTNFHSQIRVNVMGDSSSALDRHDTIVVDGCTFISPTHNGYDEFLDPDYKTTYPDGLRLPGNITITDNYFYNTGNYAFALNCAWGTNLIARNRLYDIGNGEYNTNAMQVSMARGSTIIEDNYIDTVTALADAGDGHCIIIDHAIRDHTLYSIGTIIRRNYCTGATTQINASGINVYNAQNCEVYNNIFEGNTIGIVGRGREWATGNVFYNNTIANNSSHGVKLWDEQPVTTWTNNIISDNGGYAYYIENSTDPIEIYTLYYNNTSGFSNTFSADGTDINSDPKFVDDANGDYSFQTTSPCRNAGTTVLGDTAYSYGLRDTTDWSTTPPTVYTLVQGDHGTTWDVGPYIYYDPTGPGNDPPDGTITSPATDVTRDEGETVLITGSYSDPNGDTCTYAWTFEANSLDAWADATDYDAEPTTSAETSLVLHGGVYYKCIQDHTSSTGVIEPPNASYWTASADTLDVPGRAKYSTAGIYSIALTVNDGTVDDPNPKSRAVTVNVVGATPPTTEVWTRNTSGGDYVQGDGAYINGGTTANDNYGSEIAMLVKASASADYTYKSPYLVDLVDISGETVSGSKFEFYLTQAPNLNMNVELWSVQDVLTESGVTYACAVDDNNDGVCDTAWTDTHGQDTFLGEVALTSSSSTGQYYAIESEALASYIGTRAGSIAYFILLSDVNNSTAVIFTSDDGTDGQRPKLTIDYGGGLAGTVPEIVDFNIVLADGSYKDGDVIPGPQETWNEAVTVTGTPQIIYETGANDVIVNYVSGSGTSVLTYAAFTVSSAQSHTTADLDVKQSILNGGTIVSTDDATAAADTAGVLDVCPTGAEPGSLATNKNIAIDVSPFSMGANIGVIVGGVYHADYSHIYTTAGETITIAIPLNKQPYELGNPTHPILSLYGGPESTTVVYAYAAGVVEISSVWYWTFQLIVTTGMRTLDLQTIAVGVAIDLNSGTIKDDAGNSLVLTLPSTDVGAVVISVPKTDWDLSATGDYATFEAFDTATYSVPDDKFICDYTGNLNTDVSGTSGHEIIFTGTITGQVVIDEDYINLDTLTIN